jgi:hypothetical protein
MGDNFVYNIPSNKGSIIKDKNNNSRVNVIINPN